MARVPYAEKSDLPEEHQHLIESALQGRPLHFYAAVGTNPPVLVGLRAFLSSLWNDSGLTDRDRELVLLAVSRELDAEYEWHQHARIAMGEGISRNEIIAISEGQYNEFSKSEEALIRYSIAVVNRTVDDDLHSEIAALYDDPTIVGIVSLASGYLMVAYLMEALDIELEEPFAGWTLEHGFPGNS